MMQDGDIQQRMMIQQFYAKQGYRSGYITSGIIACLMMAGFFFYPLLNPWLTAAGCLYGLIAARRYFNLGYRVYQAQRHAIVEQLLQASKPDALLDEDEIARWPRSLSSDERKSINRQAWSAPIAWSYGLPVNEPAFRYLRKVSPVSAARIAFYSQFSDSGKALLALLPGVKRTYEQWMITRFHARPQPVQIIPKLQSYIWGPKGKDSFIFKFLRQSVPPALQEVRVAEMWVGAHFKNPSLITYNHYNMPMDYFIEQSKVNVLGQKNATIQTLFKIIEADTALSWQLHDKEGEEAKQETWAFFFDGQMPDAAGVLAELYIGFRKTGDMDKNYLKDFIDKQDDSPEHYRRAYIKALHEAVNDKDGGIIKAFSNHICVKSEKGQLVLYLNEKKQPPEVMKRIGLNKGCLVVNIPGATVHALVKGVAYEVQKMADKTMRLYDHGRNQPSRPLHIEEAEMKLDFQPREASAFFSRPVSEGASSENLVMTSDYLLDRIILNTGQLAEKTCLLNHSYHFIIVQNGRGMITGSDGRSGYEIKAGQAWLIPAAFNSYSLTTDQSLTAIIISERREQDNRQNLLLEKRRDEFWNH